MLSKNRAVENDSSLDNVIIGEAQLLLAEKRTALSVLRTGITVLVLPLSVLSVLIATSRYYDVIVVLHLMIPLLALCLGLVLLGVYLITRSVIRIRHIDKIIYQLKRKHTRIAEFLD